MSNCAEDRFCHRGRCGAINFYEDQPCFLTVVDSIQSHPSGEGSCSWFLCSKDMNNCSNNFAKVCFAQCSTSRLALGSPGCSFVCRRRRNHAQNTLKNLIMLYCLNAQGPRTSKLIFTTAKYTNTQIQIHKYSL